MERGLPGMERSALPHRPDLHRQRGYRGAAQSEFPLPVFAIGRHHRWKKPFPGLQKRVRPAVELRRATTTARQHDGRLDLPGYQGNQSRSEEHTSELQSPCNLVCRLLLEKKKKKKTYQPTDHAERTNTHN